MLNEYTSDKANYEKLQKDCRQMASDKTIDPFNHEIIGLLDDALGKIPDETIEAAANNYYSQEQTFLLRK